MAQNQIGSRKEPKKTRKLVIPKKQHFFLDKFWGLVQVFELRFSPPQAKFFEFWGFIKGNSPQGEKIWDLQGQIARRRRENFDFEVPKHGLQGEIARRRQEKLRFWGPKTTIYKGK